MTTAADPAAQPAEGQLVCPVSACRNKRFFVYVVKGNVQAICSKCGGRADDLTQTEEVAL